MRNQTELMRAILTNEMAQQIIDYVSPVYGNSYVGLWLFQAIGSVLGELYDIANNLKYDANPMTSTLLLDYWESHYGLPKDTSLTTEQRRARISTKIRSHGSCVPSKLAAAISDALGGAEVDITENVSRNKFVVNVRGDVSSINPAVPVVERMKPAHLIYEIIVAPKSEQTADVKVATAVTHREIFTIRADNPH